MNTLKIWTDKTVWYVAESAEDAHRMQVNDSSVDDATAPNGWVEVTGETLTLTDDDGTGTQTRETKTLVEWVGENGPGFLASTEV